MKHYIILILLLITVACEKQTKRKFTVCKSDDNNWTTTARVECDSCTMIDIHSIDLWVDGYKMTIKGQIIKVSSN